MKNYKLTVFLAVCAFVFLSVRAGTSYGYTEPVRPILSKMNGTVLDDPDLPNRSGFKTKIDHIVAHGAVSSGLTFDPNIYLNEGHHTYDMIYVENQSAGVEIPFKNHKLSLDYGITENIFERFPLNNHIDTRARGLLDLELSDYRITIGETYKTFTDLPGTQNQSRLKQDSSNMRAGIRHETDKFGFDIGYSHLFHNYDNDDSIFGPLTNRDRSSATDIMDATYAYRFFPKMAITLEDDYGDSNFVSSNSPNYFFNDVLLGLRGDLWRNKLSTNLQLGYRYEGLTSSPVMFHGPASTFIYRGGFKYTFSDRNILDLNLERTVNDSTYQNLPYYKSDFVGLGFTHVFTRKISARANASYQRNSYPADTTEQGETYKRRDDSGDVGLTLRYDIQRWLSAEVGYEYKKAVSNFKIYGYDDNIATLKVTAGF